VAFGRRLVWAPPIMGFIDETFQRGRPWRPIVAFDFDGTLTWRDSFLAFLAWRSSPRRYATGLIRLTPSFILYGVRGDRGRLKAAVVREFLTGVSRSELEAAAAEFAARQALSLFRPDALRRWRQWQAEGARLVIVTASPEIIVAPFARGLGARALIGTRLVFDAEDRVTGALDGPNCRGREKAARLAAAFGEDVRLEAAYGDSAGDREMLDMAGEAGLRVFGERP